MKEQLLNWLRLFRAQTMPATLLLILVPYLENESLWSLKTLAVAVFAVLVHWFSFGHNSLLDYAMGYDIKDPSKQHHPLETGKITLHAAHNVIHWGLSGLAVASVLICLYISPNPLMSTISIFLALVFGYSYNSGLSKECILGFLPISICFTSMGAFGWFLSHETLDYIGKLYLAYVFCVILFQIGWSGYLKELEIKERSNILIRLGARVEIVNGQKKFVPSKSRIFAYLVKGLNLIFGAFLMIEKFNTVRLVIFVILSILILHRLHQLTKPRIYIRNKELLSMSLMEISSIYLPPWLMLDPLTAIILEVFGVLYFFSVNLTLWKMPAPGV